MKTFELMRETHNKGLAEVAKLEALYNKIDGLVRKAGFANFDAYVAKITLPVVASDNEISAFNGTDKPEPNPKKTKRKAKRTPISDAKLAKMKELLGKKVPHAKVAKEVGVSLQSVYNWEKKGFKRLA